MTAASHEPFVGVAIAVLRAVIPPRYAAFIGSVIVLAGCLAAIKLSGGAASDAACANAEMRSDAIAPN